MSGNKVELSAVAQAAKQIALPDEQVRKLLDMLADMRPEEKEKPPAVKKQWVILVSDPDGLLPKTDFAGWVLQLPEDESPATVQQRLIDTAHTYNATRKGRLYPAKTIGEAIENVPARMFREADVWAKTKTPVIVLRTDNEVPRANETAKLNFGEKHEGH
jgi:hypothetical protein